MIHTFHLSLRRSAGYPSSTTNGWQAITTPSSLQWTFHPPSYEDWKYSGRLIYPPLQRKINLSCITYFRVFDGVSLMDDFSLHATTSSTFTYCFSYAVDCIWHYVNNKKHSRPTWILRAYDVAPSGIAVRHCLLNEEVFSGITWLQCAYLLFQLPVQYYNGVRGVNGSNSIKLATFIALWVNSSAMRNLRNENTYRHLGWSYGIFSGDLTYCIH